MKKTTLLLPFLIASFFFLMSCSGGGGDGGNPVVPPPSTIGPNGGTLTSEDGKASILIPAGALSQETAITVKAVSSPALGHLGTAYQFGPDGMTFSKPLTIVIQYDPSEIPEGIDAGTFRLGKRVDGKWQVVPGSSADTRAQTVSGTVTSFNIYAIVLNTPPVADAGPDQTVLVGEPVPLDGSGSNDVDGDPLTFSWSFDALPEGSQTTLSDSVIINPTFVIDLPGQYHIHLVVHDGIESSAMDIVVIATGNSAPVAAAGPDQTVFVKEEVRLDGSGSNDVDGDPLTFSWSFKTVPPGSQVSLSDPILVNPTFTPDFPGAYTIHLVVSDGQFESELNIVIVSTENSIPVAKAGPDQTVREPTLVALNGSGSSDVDGDTLTFLWSLTTIPPGSAAILSDVAAILPTFTADLRGIYVAQLIVNDGMADSEPKTVTITTENTKPVANAGGDQTAFVGETVVLDGNGSNDADGDLLTYHWSLTSVPPGSTARLSDETALMPTFTVDLPGEYVAHLIVNDGIADSTPSTTMISTENSRPVAKAGADQKVVIGALVSLDGGASFDVDLDPLSYQWALSSRPNGSAAVLSDPNAPAPTFTADLAGIYIAQLIVSDSRLDSPPDTLLIKTHLVAPTITDFSPLTGPAGTLVTMTGTNFAPSAGFSQEVTLSKQGGGSITVPIASFSNTVIDITIPTQADSGPLTVMVEGQSVTSARSFTVTPSSGFTLKAAPPTAEIIQGESITYAIELESSDGFAQLATLSLSGLPVGMTSSFNPVQIATGQASILTITAGTGQALETVNPVVTARATLDGFTLSDFQTLTLSVVPVTTSFTGRIVITDALQSSLAGVTVTLLGRDGAGNANGCTGTTVSDAAGNFAFTNLPASCTGDQLIRYDGTTATATGTYAGVDLVYNIRDGQVTTSPVLVHLPRIDNGETVMVRQNAAEDQHFTFATIPNLSATVYAGTTLTLADGSAPDPFPLIAVQVPVDRLPEEMPPDPTMVMPFIVAFQPANAEASQPVAVSFPNLLNTPPGTAVELMTLDPTKGEMVQYGTGVISNDGTQIVPDLDPATPGRRFGLVHFDWHGPRTDPPNGTDPPPGGGAGGQGRIDYSTGIEMFSRTDIAVRGSLGTIAIARTYRTLANAVGPFGVGTSHNYSYRLNTMNLNDNLIRLIMPDGNQIPFIRQPDGTLINERVPLMRGVVMRNVGAGMELRWKNGTRFQFVPGNFRLGSILKTMTDRNGNVITLVRNPARLAQIVEVIDPVGRKLTLAYDNTDRITSISDPLGRKVNYSYNAQGTLASVTDPEGGISSYEYDGQNRLIKAANPRGTAVAQNIYDTAGRVIEQVRADGGRFTYTYTPLNSLVQTSPILATKVTDPLGNQTTYRFNPQGYLVSTTDPLGQVTVFDRESGTNLLLSRKGNAICSGCGNHGRGDRQFTYDQNGNRLTVTDALGNTTQFSYEPVFNKLKSITDPLNKVVLFSYDALGNLRKITDKNGHSTSFAYDKHGQLSTITDPINHITTLSYDAFGNMVEAVNAAGKKALLNYDGLSRLVETAGPLGRRSSIEYNHRNQVTSSTDPVENITQSYYDESGNLLSVTDARGNTTNFSYNASNRWLARTTLTLTDQRTYDLNGNLIQFTDRRGQVSQFTYDKLNRLLSETYQDGNSVQRSYDVRGRLQRVDDSVSGVFIFAYDSLGRLIRHINKLGTVEYDYDVNGRMTARRVIGQPDVSYAYDDAGRLISAQMPQAAVDFIYDARNQLITTSRSNGVISENTYDTLGQVLSIVDSKDGLLLNSQSYEYNAVGNRISHTTGIAQALVTDATTNQYGSQNRLLEHGLATHNYDQNGNLIQTTSPDGTTTYTWDSRNRLVSILKSSGDAIRFEYDFAGNMIEQNTLKNGVNTTRSFLLDHLTNVVQINETGGDPLSILTGRAMDHHLAVVGQHGKVTFALTDGLNSTVATVDENGILDSKFFYEPFGQTSTEGDDYPFLYTGRVPVSEDLYYYRARFYAPRNGRFMSEDPIGFAGGDINLFRYVGNNPLNFVDPLGLSSRWNRIWQGFGGVASVGTSIGVGIGVGVGIVTGTVASPIIIAGTGIGVISGVIFGSGNIAGAIGDFSFPGGFGSAIIDGPAGQLLDIVISAPSNPVTAIIAAENGVRQAVNAVNDLFSEEKEDVNDSFSDDPCDDPGIRYFIFEGRGCKDDPESGESTPK